MHYCNRQISSVIGQHPSGLLVCACLSAGHRTIVAYDKEFKVVYHKLGCWAVLEHIKAQDGADQLRIARMQHNTWHFDDVPYVESIECAKYEFVIPHAESQSIYSIPVTLSTLFVMLTRRHRHEFKSKMILWMTAMWYQLPHDVRVLIARRCCELFRVLDYDDYTMVVD